MQKSPPHGAHERRINRRGFLRLGALGGVAVATRFGTRLPAASLAGGSPATERIFAGIDIGASKVCVAVGRSGRDGAMNLLGVGQARSRGFGPDGTADSEAAMGSIQDALVDAEIKCDVMLRRVSLSVPDAHSNFAIQCLKRVKIGVAQVVAPAVATAEAVLSRSQKLRGSLVIDMGEAATYYAVFAGGALTHSGSLVATRDSPADDISISSRSSRLPSEELSMRKRDFRFDETPWLRQILQANADAIPRKDENSPNWMTYQWICEAFETVKASLCRAENRHSSLHAGVQLSGGCLMLPGVCEIARQIFQMPADRARPRSISGSAIELANPRFASAIGLIKLAGGTGI